MPFVLIYGVSAFLFNHASTAAAATRELEPAPPVMVELQPLADRIAAKLEQTDEVRQPRLEGSWTFEYGPSNARHRLRFDAAGGPAGITPVAPRDGARERLPEELWSELPPAAEASARSMLAAAGVDPEGLRMTGSPSFAYDRLDRTITVDLDRGTVRERTTGFDAGRLLMRLHTAHGYRGSWDRLIWALIVDLMAFAMVLWSVSGLLMWWQRRPNRQPGLLLLAVTFTTASLLAFVLNQTFAR